MKNRLAIYLPQFPICKISCLLFIWIATCALTVATPPENDSDSNLLSVTEFISISNNQNKTIYAADEKSGAIYFYNLALPISEKNINFDKFQKLHKSSIATRPSSIAYFNGQLFICDKQNKVIVSYNIDSKSEKILYQQSESHKIEPVSVHTDSMGNIFFGEDKGNKLLLFFPDTQVFIPILTSPHEPHHILTIDSDLLIFNTEHQEFYTAPLYQSKNRSIKSNPNKLANEITNFISEEIADSYGKINNVSFYDGTFYLAAEKGLFSLKHICNDISSCNNELKPDNIEFSSLGSLIALESVKNHNISHTIAERDNLFFVDETDKRVVVTTRFDKDLRPSIKRLSINTGNFNWLQNEQIFENKIEANLKVYSEDRITNTQKVNNGKANPKLNSLENTNYIDFAKNDAGDLFVIDQKLNAILRKNKTGNNYEIVYKGKYLKKPTSLVFIKNQIYVSDSETNQILRLDLIQRRIIVEFQAESNSFLTKLLYENGNLLGVDTKAKKLFRFVLKTKENSGTASSIDSDWSLSTEDKTVGFGEVIDLQMVGSVTDFTAINDTLYILDGYRNRLVLLSLADKEITYFDYKNLAKYPSVITSDQDFIYLFDDYNSSFISIPILVSINVYFEGEFASDDLIDLYKYLLKRQILPTKYVPFDEAKSYKDIMSRKDILTTGYRKQFIDIFCTLNQLICSYIRPPAIDKELSRRVNEVDRPLDPAILQSKCSDGVFGAICSRNYFYKGQLIELPNLQLKTYYATRLVKLPLDTNLYSERIYRDIFGKPLSYVAKRFSKLESDQEIEETLKKLNPEHKGDIGDEMTGKFTIPVFSTHVKIVVPKTDIDNPNSDLNKEILSAGNVTSTISMISSQSNQSANKAVTSNKRDGFIPQTCKADLPAELINHQTLTSVSYCLPEDLGAGTLVGVVEKVSFDNKNIVFQDNDIGDALRLFVNSSQASSTTLGRTDFTFNDADHATHVSGIIAGRNKIIPSINPPLPFMGVNPRAILLGVNHKEAPTLVDTDWNDVKLFNISLGEHPSTPCEATEASTKNIRNWVINNNNPLYVISANNRGCRLDGELEILANLGKNPNVIVVGATVDKYVKHKDSSYGSPIVSVMAPGHKIISVLAGGGVGSIDGTSQAAAFVTGTASMILQQKNDWRPWQVKLRILSTADLWSNKTISDQVFSGFLNIDRAVRHLDYVTIKLKENGETCIGNIDDIELRKNFTIRPSEVNEDFVLSTIRNVLRVVQDKDDKSKYNILIKDPKKPEMERYFQVPGSKLAKKKEPGTEVDIANDFKFISLTPKVCPSGVYKFSEIYDFVNIMPGGK